MQVAMEPGKRNQMKGGSLVTKDRRDARQEAALSRYPIDPHRVLVLRLDKHRFLWVKNSLRVGVVVGSVEGGVFVGVSGCVRPRVTPVYRLMVCQAVANTD